MPPRRAPRKPKYSPWTLDVVSPADIAVVREVLSEGFTLEVLESTREWNDVGSLGRVTWQGGVKWDRSQLHPVRKLRGMTALTRGVTLVAWSPFGMISRDTIYVWSPKKLLEMQMMYLSPQSHESWAHIVAHELCHLYWKRAWTGEGYLGVPDLGALASRMNLSRAEDRLQSVLRQKGQEIVRRVAGDEIVDRAMFFVQGYPPSQRGEEFLVVVVAKMWEEDSKAWADPDDVRPVKDFWNLLNDALRKGGVTV